MAANSDPNLDPNPDPNSDPNSETNFKGAFVGFGVSSKHLREPPCGRVLAFVLEFEIQPVSNSTLRVNGLGMLGSKYSLGSPVRQSRGGPGLGFGVPKPRVWVLLYVRPGFGNSMFQPWVRELYVQTLGSGTLCSNPGFRNSTLLQGLGPRVRTWSSQTRGSNIELPNPGLEHRVPEPRVRT